MAEKLVSVDDNEKCCKQYVIPSNEEVINELTKDLDCASIKSAEENDGNVNEYGRRNLDHDGNNVGSSEEEVRTKFTAGVSERESQNEENHIKVEDDFVDEEALKDVEITYSAEHKEVQNVLIYVLDSVLRLEYRVITNQNL
jgi:hypothetical protein